MIWFLYFSTLGLLIFSIFLALKKVLAVPVFKLIGSGTLLGLCFAFAAKHNL